MYKIMNTNYKDNKKIKEIIRTILDMESMGGATSKTRDLQGQLEAVAEVAFIAGQYCCNEELANKKYELEVVKSKYRQDDLKDYGEILKKAYNDLQVFLGSEQRIK